MSSQLDISGPCGSIENELCRPLETMQGAAVVCHPHPLYGGTMDNAVVRVAMERLLARGLVTVRFNFRGVGQSAGQHDQGRGELDDLRAVLTALESETGARPWVAGYSFGAAVGLKLLEHSDCTPPGLLALAPPLEHYDFSFLASSHTPLAIVYAEHDELTPEGALDSARKNWPGLRTVESVSGAGHDLGTGSGSGKNHALEAAIDRSLNHLAAG